MATHQHSARPSARKIFTVSGFGTAMEYYDFSIYGLAAALVFPKIFFPDLSPMVGTLVSFLTFGAGFLARPLGGLVIGHFGDKVGRRPMLILTLLVMGLSTFVLGCLPTADSVGMLAPVLLVLVRIVQGFAAGGEWGGAALIGIESAPDDRRGLWGSFTSVGIGIGTVLGIAVFTLVSALSGDAISGAGLAGGAWRIPFLLGGVLVVFGLVMRLRAPQESAPHPGEDRKAQPLPIFTVLRRFPAVVLCAVGISFGYITLAYVTSVFMLTYMTEIGYGDTDNLLISLAGAIALIPGAAFFALLSDRIGRKKVMIGGAGLILAVYVAYFAIVPLHHLAATYAISVVSGFVVGAAQGPIPAFLGEQFPREVRYTAISATYQVGSAIGGATAAGTATWLLIAFDGHWIGVVGYLAVTLGVLALCSSRLRETAFEPLPENRDAEGSRSADADATARP
ncbi:MFS transporter [Tsukamurella sp. M9C]|uniref:MFS transporter n=1 Tax=Tsukamurella sp. M9C TaxID=2877520 RepID=UPI001CCD9DF4|nr:MFS transporter [Tsukamurella sp. M9C]MCA0158451.1 MFS transporter [Tsukamurella sp. M9C]